MKDFTNSKIVSIILTILATIVVIANVYLIYALFFGSDGFISGVNNLGLRVFCIIIIVFIGIAYFASMIYLIFRPVMKLF